MVLILFSDSEDVLLIKTPTLFCNCHHEWSTNSHFNLNSTFRILKCRNPCKSYDSKSIKLRFWSVAILLSKSASVFLTPAQIQPISSCFSPGLQQCCEALRVQVVYDRLFQGREQGQHCKGMHTDLYRRKMRDKSVLENRRMSNLSCYTSSGCSQSGTAAGPERCTPPSPAPASPGAFSGHISQAGKHLACKVSKWLT